MTIQEQRGGRRVVEFQPRSKGPQRPHKPKGWSHQDELTRGKGKTILLSINGESLAGELIEADQFTIKVRDLETNLVAVFFKSAIAYFRIAA